MVFCHTSTVFFPLFLLIFPLILEQMFVTWLLLSSALWFPRVFLTHVRLPSWATSSCTHSQGKVELCFKNTRSDRSGVDVEGSVQRGIPLTAKSRFKDGKRLCSDREVEKLGLNENWGKKMLLVPKNKILPSLQTCCVLLYSVFISQVTQSRAS